MAEKLPDLFDLADKFKNIFIYFESIFDGAYKNGAYKYDGAWL